MELNDLRNEFWLHLHSQGFPRSINDKALHSACMEIEAQAYKGKRLSLRDWSFGFGGLHINDVALISLLAKELGLKQGFDWDWGLEPDNYHFEVAYVDEDKVRKLLNLLDLYYSESLIFVNIKLRLFSIRKSRNLLDYSEIEGMMIKERNKFED